MVRGNRTKTFDGWIVLCWAVLVVVGLLSIYSSVRSLEMPFFASRCGKQLIWAMVSVIAGAIILFGIRPKIWEVLSTPLYIGTILLLLSVLVFGTTVNGSRSWFSLGPISFQPGEISKITTSLLFAHELHSIRMNSWKDLIVVMLTLLLPMLIIFAEGETGTLLVYLGFLIVLYREGFSGWWFLALIGTALLFSFSLTASAPWIPYMVLTLFIALFVVIRLTGEEKLLYFEKVRLAITAVVIAAMGVVFILSTNYVFDHLLKPHQKNRIEVLLGLTTDTMGAGYNVNQSLIAIGSGGFSGKGFLQGTQTAYGFVPEQSTDFIFCTIGEEAGFIGCTFVIAVFCFLLMRIIVVAESCRDSFTRTYGYCVSACLSMHLIINVGMTIGIMPVIGIPLPFISYGGSSLLSFSVMLSIFLALVREDRKYF